jgi:hypothetical protein
LEFHPAVQRDFSAAMDYYTADAEGGRHLADRFEAELRDGLAAIKSGPWHLAFFKAAPSSGEFGSAISLTLSFIARSWTSGG